MPSPSIQAAITSSNTIHIGLGDASASNGGIYVADGLGFFQQQGLVMDYLVMGSASEVLPALTTGASDLGDQGMNPALFNAVARGLNLKLVADKGSMPPGFGFTSILVPADRSGQITGPADLKGKKIALTPPGLGTANGYALSIYLAQAGLTVQDVDIVPISFPDQIAALANHSVDVAISAEPFATSAVQNGIATRLITLDQVVPNQQVGGLVFTDSFIANHRDLAVRFLVAYIQGIRVYNAAFTQGVNKDQVVQILADKTNIKDAGMWSAMIPAGLDPDARLNLSSIADEERYFNEIGLVQDPPDISSFVDTSFQETAAQMVGPAAR